MRKLIGSGHWTKVYKTSVDSVEIHSCDVIKEGIALYGSDNVHLPQLTRVAKEIYTSPFYHVLENYGKGLRRYKKLISYLDGHLSIGKEGYYRYIQAIENLQYIEISLRLALYELCEIGLMYNDIFSFEFPADNLAIHNGKLLLLDVLFISDNFMSSEEEDLYHDNN